MANLLKGITHDSSEAGADLVERHKIVFALLDDNESGEINSEELEKFLRELFKEQIKDLQQAMEKQNQGGGMMDEYDQSTNN